MTHISVKLKCLNDYSGYPDVVEDGKTFEENAKKKARAYFEYSGIPAFADDSGLVVPALNGEPGILSARYAGKHANYEDNNRLLIDKIKSVPEDKREGKFVCTICYVDKNYEKFITGTCSGIILDRLQGTEGFGYDPLFYVPELGKTFAELPMEEKNKISHRGRALIQFQEFLKNKILDR
jgi:XTP/dITP diphosphohydrolase